ncbi:Alpha/Beta hydrolase protein [Diaporthe sp. PMI_573]|nr:Alpha/Beta hydrolase protein [Diaporthaceae sp. PMI_573]
MPFITIAYKRLHYTDYPAASDVTKGTIVCHHGLGSSQNFYTPIVPRLTQAGFQVITFDTTGAGRSSYTQIEQSVSSLADDVLELIDALSVKGKVIAVGHSMGGMVVTHLAAEHKQRIQAVVLLGPVYPSEGVSKVFEKRIETVEREGMEAMANTIPTAATGSKSGPLVAGFIRELLLGQDKAGYLSNCRVIANATRPSYENVECRVLLLAGEEDKSAPLEASKKMFEEFGTVSSNKRLEVLSGVGHWHCIEEPVVVSDKIVEFLS